MKKRREQRAGIVIIKFKPQTQLLNREEMTTRDIKISILAEEQDI